VKIGEFMGYGTSFLAERKMKVAVIPIGYSHGYSSLSNQEGFLSMDNSAL
jgi:alanine racemase